MKFIKRFVFIVILLFLAFFFYRLISPDNTKALLNNIKSFSNTTFGTSFVLQNDEEIIIEEIVDEIDEFVEEKFDMDNDLLLLNHDEAVFDPIEHIESEEIDKDEEVVSTPTVSSPSTTTPSSSSPGLSSQDERDFKKLFGN